jgi:hypothetical protein
MRGNSLNTRDYDSVQEIISDIETIWSRALLQELKVPRSRYKASVRARDVEMTIDKFAGIKCNSGDSRLL